MKKIFLGFSIFMSLFVFNFTYAEDVVPDPVLTSSITIRDGGNVIFTGVIPINSDSTVLSLLNDADTLSPDFNVSNIQNFSFGAYLKCITDINGERCDNWQYAVNNLYTFSSIDQYKLNGGENVYIYFGPQNKVILSSNNINTNNILTVIAQKYNYQNNTWEIRTDVTVGLTQPDLQPNPNNNWLPPLEIKTNLVDENGQVTFSSISVGSYDVGVQEDGYFPTEKLDVISAPVIEHHSSGGGRAYILPPKPVFSTQNAINYLKSLQVNDGSFGGSDMYTDWVGIALSAGGVADSSTNSIISYFSLHPLKSSLLTDIERRAMTLLALGQDPYSFNNTDYIFLILKNFDGIQFGDKDLVNDDIFALIPLSASGYKIDDEVISKDINFILSKQKTDGSWEESVDVTSASIQALSLFNSLPTVSDALSKASLYVMNSQKDDGGWGNVYSTSWAVQAGNALNIIYTKNGHTGLDYFANNQISDGGVLSLNETLENRVWATSYVIPAMLSKTWNSIFHQVLKPVKVDTKDVVSKIVENKLKEKVVDKKIDNIISIIKKVKKEIVVSPETEKIETKNMLTASAIESQTRVTQNETPSFWHELFAGVGDILRVLHLLR